MKSMFSRNYVQISSIFNKLLNPVNPGIPRDYCFFNPGSRDSQNRPGLSSLTATVGEKYIYFHVESVYSFDAAWNTFMNCNWRLEERWFKTSRISIHEADLLCESVDVSWWTLIKLIHLSNPVNIILYLNKITVIHLVPMF